MLVVWWLAKLSSKQLTWVLFLASATCLSFPGDSKGKESDCNVGDWGSISRLGRSPGEGHGSPLMFLPGNSHGQRSPVGYSPWRRKELDMTE